MPLKYHGLELPIFNPEDYDQPLVVGKKDLRSMKDSSQDTLLRFVFTTGPGEQDLKERIKRSSEEFDKLEDLTGKPTVPFQFGLFPIEEPQHLHLAQPYIVPEDFVLAAEVAVLQNTSVWYTPRPIGIWRGIHQYRNSGGELVDIGIRQYARGQTRCEMSPEWYMVDIEPRLRPAK